MRRSSPRDNLEQNKRFYETLEDPAFSRVFLMSVFSVALCGKNRRVHKAVVFYLLVEGIMVVIGDNFPRTAACLPPYWGMIQQVGGSSTGYLFGIIILSAVIIVVSAVFIKKGLRA